MKNFIPKLIVLTFTILFSLNSFSQSAKYIPTAGIDPLGDNSASIDMQQTESKTQMTEAKANKKDNNYSNDANKNTLTLTSTADNKNNKTATKDKLRSDIAFGNYTEK